MFLLWKTIQKHGGMVEGQKSLGCSTSQYFLWFHDYEPSYHIFCFIDRSGFIREISCFLIELVVSFRLPSFLVLVERHRCGVLKKWLCGVGYHKLPIYNNIVTLDIEKLKFAIAISTSIYTMHLFFSFQCDNPLAITIPNIMISVSGIFLFIFPQKLLFIYLNYYLNV